MTIDDALRAYASGHRSAKETKDRTGLGYVQVLDGLGRLNLRVPPPAFDGPDGDALRESADRFAAFRGRRPNMADSPLMLIGYARVSTSDQNLTLQTDALTAAGCERICSDKASGAKTDRPGLSEALNVARRGDTLVVWKLDRLGRSMKGLVELAADLATRGIELRSLTDGIDTATPTGRLLFHILASIAEMERELIRERTMAGLLAARRKNGPGRGRKSVLTPKRATAMKLLAAGDRPRDVAEAIGVSVATFYRHFPAGGSEPGP
ncbi:DNA invertase Pin-like site-specific DNA recombinase [Sphingomonas sp. PP-CE-3G-477]|jgi:DNA invertase Pin-like site-specific DNA recombinase|uniref:DNA invertase Pin-like site-specific DNA recombinase n=2 Tax=Sphingomonadaceae TaxID=41297 RepID=A0A2T5TW20_9SPHN|nr:DNA invertase Pin-like site-specific DNA recombinase [Sphingomonas sp. PP-CE-3G-477]PTW43470.1 DNA invertase Pin-like site-specific DNA recombinase [Sphingomonas faeni]